MLGIRSKVKRFGILLSAAAASCLAPPPASKPAVGRSAHRDCRSDATTDIAAKAWDIPMLEVCSGIFAEKGTPEPLQRWVLGMNARALDRVDRFFAGLKAEQPEVILCSTDDCRRYFAGRADNARSSYRGRSGERGTIIITSIDARFEGELVHEMSHAELHTRIGQHRVPAWFNEGLATYVSHSPSCVYAPLAELDDIRALDDSGAWSSETDAPNAESWAIYCRARREFERWYLHHGSAHFFALLQGVERGESFDDLYGTLLTQD